MTIEEAKVRIEALERELASVKSSLNSAKSDIVVLGADISNVSARLGQIEANGLGTQVNNMQNTLKIQDIRVGKLERESKYGKF